MTTTLYLSIPFVVDSLVAITQVTHSCTGMSDVIIANKIFF